MPRRLRNITITVEEDVARWARIEAAKRDSSVSALLAEMLKERMLQESEYDRAMRESLARKPFGRSDGKYLTRAELYGRARARRENS
jgi:hypothetical protein